MFSREVFQSMRCNLYDSASFAQRPRPVRTRVRGGLRQPARIRAHGACSAHSTNSRHCTMSRLHSKNSNAHVWLKVNSTSGVSSRSSKITNMLLCRVVVGAYWSGSRALYLRPSRAVSFPVLSRLSSSSSPSSPPEDENPSSTLASTTDATPSSALPSTPGSPPSSELPSVIKPPW